MSMCICLHLPVLILSVDSDWLISIKVGQSLTGNRNVRQNELGQTDQVNFDSVNRL